MYWRRYSTLQVASGLSGVYADGETGQEKIEVDQYGKGQYQQHGIVSAKSDLAHII